MDGAGRAQAAGTLTGELARFGAAFSLDDVPEDDRHYAKLLALDLLGCALAGLDTEEARIALRAARALSPGGGNASLWGTGEAAQPGTAAMVNGTAAHALELDDFHGVDHSGAVTVPALMAAADAGGEADGRRFLEGMAFGYEVGRRLLDGAGGYRRHNATGWHTTGTLGSYAAAAAVAKLLRLDEERTVWALGIAGSFTGGTWAFNSDGAMSKRYHAGVAAQMGLQAAFLAREGFTGPVSVLEAERGGYFPLYGEGMTPAARGAAEGLGTDFRIGWAGVKVYACCRGIHSALDVALDFRLRHGLRAEDIESVHALCTPVQKGQLGLGAPRTRIEAQFSLPYSVAVAFLHGEAGYEFFTEKWIGNPEIEALAGKVTLEADESRSLEEEPVLTVRTRDGRVLAGQQPIPIGDPANPVPEADIRAKYRALATRHLSPGNRPAAGRSRPRLGSAGPARRSPGDSGRAGGAIGAEIGRRLPVALLDEMSRRIHTLVQYAHHQNAAILRHLEHCVRPKKITPQARCKRFCPGSGLGIFGEEFEAPLQPVQVVPRLPQAEIRDCKFVDAAEVVVGPPRQPKGGHRRGVGPRPRP